MPENLETRSTSFFCKYAIHDPRRFQDESHLLLDEGICAVLVSRPVSWTPQGAELLARILVNSDNSPDSKEFIKLRNCDNVVSL